MIFNTTDINIDIEESYKERNLYYKIFAGYLFNELVPGYEIRKMEFIDILIKCKIIPGRIFGDKSNIEAILEDIKKSDMHVTFDYHTAQIFKEDKKNNRGEMSDILLLTKKNLLSVECKFLTNIHITKDVIEVQKRILKFSSVYKLQPIQILLIKQSKWLNARQITLGLENHTRIPVIVLYWETLMPLLKDLQVNQYLSFQLNRKNNISL